MSAFQRLGRSRYEWRLPEQLGRLQPLVMGLLSSAVAVDSKGVSGHLREGQVGNRLNEKYPVEDVQRQMSRVTKPL